MSSIPGVGTKIPHAKGHSQKKKKKRKQSKTTRKKDNVAKQDELGWEVGGEFMEMVASCWTLKGGEMNSQREEAMALEAKARQDVEGD